MALSIFILLAAAHAAVAVFALVGRHAIGRRLRRPRLALGAACASAAVLVPALLVCELAVEPSALHPVVEVLSIGALAGLVALALTDRIDRSTSGLPRRVLAVGAHPDDLELGCGGTLAKLADSGHEIRGLVMTHGEQGGDARLRPDEARDSGRFVGMRGIEVHGFTDTRLADHAVEMVGVIEEAIRRFNPDIVLTHSRHDQHQDHQAVHLATLRAARRHSSILCYESPSATADFSPSVFVDITDHIDVKTSAVGAHVDQSGKPYMSGERVRGLAVYRGGQAKVRHAEGYEPVRLLGSAMGEL